jgi:predicted aspartyl protease
VTVKETESKQNFIDTLGDIDTLDDSDSEGPLVQMLVNGVETIALVDSGARVTMVTSAFCKELGVAPKTDKKHALKWFEGTKLQSVGAVLLMLLIILYC